MNYNTVIIGSGVAGMTAAIYLKRANIDFCLIEKEAPGGQILRTASINNYPGFSSISGYDLAINIYNQLNALEVDYKFTEVIGIKIENDTKIVKLKDGEITCKNIIIATGRYPRKLDVAGMEELIGKGISFCASCDGNLYKDKKVAVIGGGRAALEETLYLSKICSSITLIHRRDVFRADEELIDSVKSNEKVNILTNKIVNSFEIKDDKLSAIKVSNKDNQIEEIEVDGCFLYIGQIPNTKCFSNLDILDKDGYIEVDSNYETKYKGIYAIGDCTKKDFYQIITAEADAIVAANRIIQSR